MTTTTNHDLAQRLRYACTSVRAKNYPLADLIPLMQQAADALQSEPAGATFTAKPTKEQAYEIGANGSPATEDERLLFEEWMRGHCWALSATWDGKGYRSDAEQRGNVDPWAMQTRRIWAAWRDRAALATLPPAPSTEGESNG